MGLLPKAANPPGDVCAIFYFLAKSRKAAPAIRRIVVVFAIFFEGVCGSLPLTGGILLCVAGGAKGGGKYGGIPGCWACANLAV